MILYAYYRIWALSKDSLICAYACVFESPSIRMSNVDTSNQMSVIRSKVYGFSCVLLAVIKDL